MPPRHSAGFSWRCGSIPSVGWDGTTRRHRITAASGFCNDNRSVNGDCDYGGSSGICGDSDRDSSDDGDGR